jgi:membrane-bound lytic murein transglycosylase D
VTVKPPAEIPPAEPPAAAVEPQVPPEKPVEAEKDVADLLEDAFAAYEEAQSALEREDMDGALAKLDEAYGILLKMSLPADSPLVQEKNDLRLLVAQRIQKISASRTTLASSVNGSIPLVENQWVLREIKSFQTLERKAFEESYRRSGLYRAMILEELRKEGLPEQLAWIPLIESAFKPRALSRARALGMWQFIRSTGYRYGLKRDKYVDERMDPVKATRAAIQYMIELHALFGDWLTAIAAYNCGEGQVQRAIRAQKVDYFDSFWDLFVNLPFETARHVPRFIATLLIVGDPAKYGFDFPAPDPPLTNEAWASTRPSWSASIPSSSTIRPRTTLMISASRREPGRSAWRASPLCPNISRQMSSPTALPSARATPWAPSPAATGPRSTRSSASTGSAAISSGSVRSSACLPAAASKRPPRRPPRCPARP